MSAGVLLAGSSAAQAFVFNNINIRPYIGIKGGVTASTGRFSSTNVDGGDSHCGHFGRTSGLVGGVLGAQTTLCNNVFLAVEGNALWNDGDQVIHRGTNTAGIVNNRAKIRNDFVWGFDGRIGYTFCNVSPYILGGFESGEWRLKLSNETTASFQGIPPGSYEFKRTLYGPKVGAGVTFPITCNLYMNFEYSFTWFGKVSNRLLDSVTEDTWARKTRYQLNAYTLGFNYLF